MALIKAQDVQKELYDAVEQINVILKGLTSRLDELEKPKPVRKANGK
jgi:hypothetical protein